MAVPPKGLTRNLVFAVAAAGFLPGTQHGFSLGLAFVETAYYGRCILIGSLIPKEFDDIIFGGLNFHRRLPTPLVWFTALVYSIGGVLGGLSSGLLAGRLGPKRILLVSNVVLIPAVILQIIPFAFIEWFMRVGVEKYWPLSLFFVGRFLLGLHSGLVSGAAPIYVHDITPIGLCGTMGTSYQLGIGTGFMIAAAICRPIHWFGFGLSGLHWAVTFVLLPSFIQFYMLWFCGCPESPVYLMEDDPHPNQAKAALAWLRSPDDHGVAQELEALKVNQAQARVPSPTLKDMFTDPSSRRSLLTSCALMVAQHFTGFPVLLLEYVTIISMVVYPGHNLALYLLAVGGFFGLNLLSICGSSVLTQRGAGRRLLLLIGYGVMLLGMVTVYVSEVIIQASLLGPSTVWTPSQAYIVPLVGLYICAVGYGLGPGPIPWYYAPESFDNRTRHLGMSLALGFNWASSVMLYLGLTIQSRFHQNDYKDGPLPLESVSIHVLGVFTTFLVAAGTFTWFMVPEIKVTTSRTITSAETN